MPKVVNYDPAIRETPEGSRIYSFWRKVRGEEHAQVFEDFSDFYEWAVKTYVFSARLKRKDPTKPHSPDNSYFEPPKQARPTADEFSEKQIEWMYEWNRAVNRIRKYYNMAPLPGTSYEYT